MNTEHITAGDAELPAFLNPGSGTADLIEPVLTADPGIRLHKLNPDDMAEAIRRAVAKGTPRIIVSGGDGTIALAASILAGSSTELAVIPGGTLNHFARRHGIPLDTAAASACARNGQPRKVDVGYVNDHLFINTSSVGAYVVFVRTRDRLEHRMNYYSASALAGIHRLLRLRSRRFRLAENDLRTPLIFIGVGERELRFPFLGEGKPGGENSLHVIAVRHSRWSDAIRLAVAAALKGAGPLDRENAIDSLITDEITIRPRRGMRRLYVAVDGEVIKLKPPLQYRMAREAFSLVVPANGGATKDA